MQISNFLTTNGENLQYLFYFTLLLLLGTLEGSYPVVSQHETRLKRWKTNFGLTCINIVVLGALPVSGIMLSEIAGHKEIGLLNSFETKFWIALLVTFLVRSFSSWINHLIMHKIPFLWKIHRVHHLDTFLDISTTVRFHPIEFIINLIVTAPFILFFGLPAWTLMAYEILDIIVNLFSHSNIRLNEKMDKLLRILIVTPGMHRIHHSSFIKETNSNYGAVFSFWDRVFKTYKTRRAADLPLIKIGLNTEEETTTKLRFLLWTQFFLK